MNQQPTFHATTWKLSPFGTSCSSRASDALTSLIDWVIFGNYSILRNLTEVFFKCRPFWTHTVARKWACLFVLARPFRRIHWFVIKLNEAFDDRETRTRIIKRFVQIFKRTSVYTISFFSFSQFPRIWSVWNRIQKIIQSLPFRWRVPLVSAWVGEKKLKRWSARVSTFSGSSKWRQTSPYKVDSLKVK